MLKEINRSPETIAIYRYVVKGLVRHAQRMKSQNPLILSRHKGVLLSIACLDTEPHLPESFARNQVQAAIYAIQNWPGYFNPRALELLCPEPSETESDRVDRVTAKRAAVLSKSWGKAKETSSQLPIQQWKRIIDRIVLSKSKWAAAAADWLCATLITGLRPNEWRAAKLEANQLSITSVGFDHESKRNLEPRTIDLLCTSTEVQCVHRFLKSVKLLDDQGFHRMYEGVRALTRTVGQRTLPDWDDVISIDAARQTSLAISKLKPIQTSKYPSKPQTDPGVEWSRALRAQAAMFEDRTRACN